MRMRVIALAALLAIAPGVAAQELPAPRTDLAAIRKEAMADPAIRAAIGEPSRSTEALLKDERRDPAIILKASKAKPGDRVLDMGSGNGYLALLFSSLVGPKGHVDIQNTPGWISQFPWQAEAKQSKVIKNPNIGWVIKSWNELEQPADTYDVVVMGRIYHDVILEGGNIEVINKRVFTMLKPGGYVLIEDHDADPAMPVEQQAFLHRISHQDTAKQFIAAGFTMTDLILFESKSDDQRFNVFRPGVKGRTDHFIAVFQKPLDGKPAQ